MGRRRKEYVSEETYYVYEKKPRVFKAGRRCNICGAVLSIYNSKNICKSHKKGKCHKYSRWYGKEL